MIDIYYIFESKNAPQAGVRTARMHPINKDCHDLHMIICIMFVY